MIRKEFFKHYYIYIKSKILAGIYLHIPYCQQACHYCNFHFSTSLKNMEDMIGAIGKELNLRKDYLNEEINTIYFGGGTPSLLADQQISYLLNEINNAYNVSPNAEITLEANPEDINKDKAKSLIDAGINRISLGVQSFDDEILISLNRLHSKTAALEAIQILQDTGFINLTIDLIYGIPGQSIETWQKNLVQATELEIPHLSCYALTIEEKTAFGQWQKTGKLNPVTDLRYEEDYNVMCNHLAEKSYVHYEVSNFAKPGRESQHNSSYWQQAPYLGLGPGAHSYNRERRQFNVSNNATYIKSLALGKLSMEEEILTRSQIYNEYLLTGLRTNNGIDLTQIKQNFGFDILDQHRAFLQQCDDNNLVVFDDNHLKLTDKALILADSIIIELMIND
jgi:oxygen-independent coproporphyrinogen-3 oxidase